MKFFSINSFFIALISLIAFISCRKPDTLEFPENRVIFEEEQQGLAASEDSLKLKLVFSRATESAGTVKVAIVPTGVVYGADFTTYPATQNNTVSVNFSAGAKEAFVTIKKVNGVYYYGTEKLQLAITDVTSPALVGAAKTCTISFSEIIATYDNINIDGGGPTYPNKVFIDLSANRQKAVNRTTWDLGFYTDPSTYRVIINSSSAMMAKQLAKNDMNAVSSADTAGISGQIAFSLFAPDPVSLPYIDYPNGDLTKTAIAEISANAADNKVYIVNRGMGIGSPAPARGWKKIRILRNTTGGYTLQYADLNATTFQEMNISKDATYFFNYVNLDGNTADVEPAKRQWDIAWTHFSNTTNFGTGEVPYLYQDIILQNKNVQTAKVMTATKAFADFVAADTSSVTFSTNQIAIGADWRSGGGPTSAPAVRTDRYYIIKDANNNIYKLRFTALTQGGQRGYPAFEAALLKKG